MAHNKKCAEARFPRCDCECGGSRHGCQGVFNVADGTREDVLFYREQREKDWVEKPSNLTWGQAAIGCAQADVAHWLHRDRNLLVCARAAQRVSFEDTPDEPAQGLVLRRVTEHLGQQQMEGFQVWARETHFWCEVLAQMARALALYEEVRERMFAMVEDAFQRGGGQALPDGLSRAGAIGSAVQWTWRYVLASVVAASGAGSLMALLSSGNVQPLLWPVRVIAVLMCPDASRHRAVREYCWQPIAGLVSAEVRHEVRERLAQVFSEDPWPMPN